jgi:N-acetyl-beta-hexosaminidase
MLGPEACLWTETVPQWRVWHKIQPRLAAYAEVAWSLPQHKDYAIFRERKELLKAAGYEEYLASL